MLLVWEKNRWNFSQARITKKHSPNVTDREFLQARAKLHDFNNNKYLNNWIVFPIVVSDLCPLPSTFCPLTLIPFVFQTNNNNWPYNYTVLCFYTSRGSEGDLWCTLACLSLIIVKVIAESCAWSFTMRCWSTSRVGNFTQTQEAQSFSSRGSQCCGAAGGLMGRSD